MTGLVLCGGKSSRMGTDKALLKLGEITWLENATSLFKDLQLPYLISCNRSQYEAFSKIISPDVLVVDKEIYGGPLRGIMSVYSQYQDDFFVLASDMPYMNTETLNRLVLAFDLHRDADSVVYKNGALFEPLCGIYTNKGLSKLSAYLSENRMNKKYALQYILSNILNPVHLVPDDFKCFKNINTPDDLV